MVRTFFMLYPFVLVVRDADHPNETLPLLACLIERWCA